MKYKILGFVFIAVFFCSLPLWAQENTTQGDQTGRIAIISAFGAEIVKLKNTAIIEKEAVINGRTFVLCEIEGKKAVLFLSGVSMINAAMTTQLALDHFNITHILFSGIAGGVNPNLNIGDVVVPARWAEYQESIFAKKTGDGYDLGWHKEIYPGFGMMFPQPVDLTHDRLKKADALEEKFWFDVDSELLAVAKKIQSIELVSEAGNVKLSNTPKLVVGGTGVSGMSFVDNSDYRTWIFETFNAGCLDMESAAVAHVAYVNHIPFIAFRSLSDLAGGGEGENEINTFFKLAADNAAHVLLRFLEVWH
ncbi:5'-methylthioadenosine/S-adenosylhomocysteine nucleosidase [Desulforhopalus sp. IMCC35007]|uniref:5'-methylthioadenosine/S-adenosylhomocysteine nucleosidase n=1 Tax=Desulforhopalus sp. IMCC35007 TaxID=2569543 RepID=UPI0010AE4501|nr:5'-methylthioadenosine/S-adenosylhomocysteine nucleosidase [Desulforhopalus sp. IMCC35007]TKB05634.1 5'-methylthioadenosine/S-adenosylhomocysteine nucleosidase [Desulforhopalus sp. IMCC35007]